MNFLGEYEKETSVLLELHLKNKNGFPVLPDSTPVFSVEKYSNGGIQTVFESQMDLSAQGKYAKNLFLSSQMDFGDYTVTYRVFIKGKAYETKERFRVVETNDFIQKNMEITERLVEMIAGQDATPENVTELIQDLKKDVLFIKDKVKVNNDVTSDEKKKVTSKTLKTPKGMETRVMYNLAPLKDAVVTAYIVANNTKIVADQTRTNSVGEWELMLFPREYLFEFVHPNGFLLFSLKKVIE